MKAENKEAINEQRKINEDLRKDMQKAKERLERLQHMSQQARQQAEDVQRQQLSASEEQKRKLDGD
jgi:hypothetical protein